MRRAIGCACLLLQLVFAEVLGAQANRATITGTVRDSSGAPMAGVEVSSKNLGTNLVTSAVTNTDGIYSIPNLFPGTYSLEFKKTGFKPLTFPRVTLESTQVAEMNAALQVGAVTETLTVTTDAPVLDRESATVGTNLKGDVATDLPLSIYGGGRFVENFAVALTPGYSPYSSPYGAVVNGSQWFTKDYTIDGTSGTSSIRGDSLETGPSLEAVQELQAQTSGIDSASAITNGGVMSFTMKSGTNKFHGSLFGYGHNELLDANSWTNDLTGAPKAKARAWDYGASLGGPIRKGKLFFFGAFERYTQTDFTLGGFTSGTTVPTTNMLSGDFSQLLGNSQCTDPNKPADMGDCGTADGNTGTFSTPITVQNTAGQTVPLQKGMVFDPTTCNQSTGQCQQFAGNMIPTSRFSSVAQKILNIYQKDYTPQQPGLNGNDRFPLSNSPAQTPNQGDLKLDYTLTSKDKLSGSWIIDHRPRTLLDSGGVWEAGSSDGGPLADARLELVKGNQFRASEAHTIGSNILNVFSETYNWYWNGNEPASTGTNWNQQLGLGGTQSDNFPVISFGQAVNGFGITSIGNVWGGHFVSGTLITGDTLTWSKGRHTMSFGGDFWDYQVNSHSVGGSAGIDSFNFVPNTTAGAYSGIAGFGFASFLLGDVSNASQTTPVDLYGRRKALDAFAQDSYKVTSKLTLSAGLRWQYSLQFHEKYGHWANYDIAQIDSKYGFPGKLVFPSNSGDSFETKEYWDGFGPQVGFAYSPVPKWVVRGSFSLTLLPPNVPQFDGTPDQFAPQYKGTNSVTMPFDWDSGYPGKFVPGSTSVDPGSFFGLVYTDPHSLMPGFADAINVGVQYELTPNMRVEVAYVGNRGHHLPDTALAWNQPSLSSFLNVEQQNPGLQPFGDFSSWNFSGVGCTKGGGIPSGFGFGAPYAGITCPYNGFGVNNVGNCATTQTCAALGSGLAAIAPSPQLAAWSTNFFLYDLYYAGLPIGQTSYNSMVVDLVKRTGRGLTMDVNYTYSRQRGDTYTSQQEYNAYYTPVQDFANLPAAANSLTNYDLTHIVKGYVTYELPFGRGQRWASNKSGFINGLVGGWRANTIVLYTSGQPMDIVVNNIFYPIWGNFYPNFNPHPTAAAGTGGFSGAQALTNPAYNYQYFANSVATSPINSITGAIAGLSSGGALDGDLRCPGQANENASVLKYFSMGADGQYQLSLRVEFYNLFNRHYYAINGCAGSKTQIGAGNFADVTGVNSTQRTGQFGLRFTF